MKAFPSFVSGLSQLDLLPISHLLIRDDIIFLWKLYNNQMDVDSNPNTISLPTRSATNNLFVVPKTHKFWSDQNFFMQAPRTANELTRQQIISFEMPLGIFKSTLNKLNVQNQVYFYYWSHLLLFCQMFLENLSVLS